MNNEMKLNDLDYANNLLQTLKEMTKNLALAITEASNEELYNKYMNMFNTYSMMQREIFEYLNQKGWYKVNGLSKDKLQNKYQTLNQELINLNIT